LYANTEEWNGSSWTEVADLNLARGHGSGAGQGTTEAALMFGGDDATVAFGQTESWNGSSWTEVNNLNTARSSDMGGLGEYTSAICAGGETPGKAEVEDWNGVSWQETTDLNTGRYVVGSGGTATDGMIFGGRTGTPVLAISEEWSGSSNTTKVLTD
jgi:hypothetical protein